MPRLNYRPIGAHGEPYPPWLRQMRRRHGAYAIRIDGEVVYVGESHKAQLYGTVTRHFQAWGRRRVGLFAQLRREIFGSGDPGHTYHRADCQVAILPTATGRDAQRLQAALIRRLNPRDNVMLKDEPEETPF